MCLDRFNRDDKLVSDLGVGGTQDQPFEHLAFTIRKRCRQRGIRRYRQRLDTSFVFGIKANGCCGDAVGFLGQPRAIDVRCCCTRSVFSIRS
jgi:hypothetical protein